MLLPKQSNIGTAMVWYFLRENGQPDGPGKYIARTLHDFLDDCPKALRNKHKHLGLIARIFCHKLIAEGFLFSVGFDPDQELPYSERFVSYYFGDELAEYGDYDFTAIGFKEIVHRFQSSVIKLSVVSAGDTKVTTGTAFLIDNSRMVTAAHCLPEHSTVTVEGWEAAAHPIKKITTFGRLDSTRPFFSCRGLEDLAVIEFESDPYPETHKFALWGAGILDDCLVMGYPNIAGFDFPQIAGTGQVVSEHDSYARKQRMLFVDVRVKGGNSGGPVINRFGRVIGVITNSEASGEKDIQELGYALATPAQTLLDLVNSIEPENPAHEPEESVPERPETTVEKKEIFNIKFEAKGVDSIRILS